MSHHTSTHGKGVVSSSGTSGDDTLDGGNGKDLVAGSDGNDTLLGGNGKDLINGEAGDDMLSGGRGNDVLNGGDGNDMLCGGIGHDLLTGGTGADTFRIDSSSFKGGSDTVTDFEPLLTMDTTTTDPTTGETTTTETTTANDVLDLHGVLHGFDPLTSNLSDFVHFTEVNGSTVVSLDCDGTARGAHFTEVATLQNATGLDPAALLAAGALVIS